MSYSQTDNIAAAKEIISGLLEPYSAKTYPLDASGMASSWYNIEFSEYGVSKYFAALAYGLGLEAAGNKPLAELFLEKLYSSITEISDFGGEIELKMKHWKGLEQGFVERIERHPKYRATIDSAAELHSFSLNWYQLVHGEEWTTILNTMKKQPHCGVEILGEYNPRFAYILSHQGALRYDKPTPASEALGGRQGWFVDKKSYTQ